MSEVEPTADRRLHETLAKQINGEVWSLLDKPDRTVEEDERLVFRACHSGEPLEVDRELAAAH